MSYRKKYYIALGVSVLVILYFLFVLFEKKIFTAIHFFIFWGNGRLIDVASLMISSVTLLGLGFAFWQYREASRRQDKIDSNSVSMRVGAGVNAHTGIFEVSNYGSIPHRIKIQKATLNDGMSARISTEDKTLNYTEVFSGIIKPGQVIEMHLFNIDATDLFVFRGVARVVIDNKNMTLVKVRFSGAAAEVISDSFDVHPIGRWVIYSQEEGVLDVAI